MDPKSISVLEFPKILNRLASYASFSGGEALAGALAPTTDPEEARRRQQETTEARKLLSVKTDVTIGGARDVRPVAGNAAKGGVLQPVELMDVRNTLLAARALRKTLSRLADQFPRLARIAEGLDEPPGIVEVISRTIDERGAVLDSASDKLGLIRRELKIAHDRLMEKLQRLVGDPKHAPHLQEAIITQRGGRYVVPLKAEFRGKVRGIVHDQSASGATLFVEPLATVELNNRWRELQLEEEEEIRRILAAVSALVGAEAERIARTVDALAALDLAFAKAKYADAIRASEPSLLEVGDRTLDVGGMASALESSASDGANLRPPTPDIQPPTSRSHPGTTVKLLGARHPLLDPETVVPIDVELDERTYVMVITGPNTGGKTVSLKTVGLLALMAQAGMHIPARSGSALTVFTDVFADIGDEQSIEQSLSTFSSHITNTIRILKQAGERSLVILDELGSGTDPAEGSALARAILSYLLDLGATTFVATHYPELKAFANNTPGVANASVEFDLETLRPTYHLTIGLPGRSNAFAIAARLGLDPTIIDDARTMVSTADLEAEKLLNEIHRQRDVVREERERAEAARDEAERLERDLGTRLETLDDERRRVLDAARAEAAAEVEAVRAELQALRKSLAAARSFEAVREAEARVEEVETAAEGRLGFTPAPVPEKRSRPPRLGDKVFVRTLGMEGTVLSLGSTDAEVLIGRLRVRARLDELGESVTPPAPSSRPTPKPAREPRAERSASPGLELDLRGQMVDDGLMALERYLDQAYMAGLPWVRIIHGKGTGKLRTAVREALRANPVVAAMEAGKDGEGGDGVTVARLALAD